MPDIYIDEDDELFIETVRRHGLEMPDLPKWSVLRIALGKSLSMPSMPDESFDTWHGRSKNYDLEQVTWKGQKGDDLGGRDITDGVCALLSVHHNENLFKNEEQFRRLLQRHIRRGLHEIKSSWRSGHDFYDYLYHEFFSNIASSDDAGVSGDVGENLISALKEIGVSAKSEQETKGPRMTRYFLHIENAREMEILRKGLDKLCFLLGLPENSLMVRGTSTPRLVGLDIPRPRESWKHVAMSELHKWISETEHDATSLNVWPGVDILGNPYHFNLVQAPHLLIGGTTGSGKSVCVHTLLLSLLMQFDPEELQVCLIDTKRVEFGHYRDLPHLYQGKVITDAGDANETLSHLIEEMETRTNELERIKVSNLADALETGKVSFPRIVIFIEELADLFLQSNHEVENRIIRIAQVARAVGIHLVLATQRPDAKTFSGLIRSNIRARIALTVQKSTESKIILDQTGAEKLLMNGDMLVKVDPGKEPERVHGVHITRDDINTIVKSAIQQKRSL